MEKNYTPLADIPQIHAKLTSSFDASRTRPIEFRLRQLRKLYHVINDNKDEVVAALDSDISKPSAEAILFEINGVLKEILFALDNLESWARDESADVPMAYKLMMSPLIRKDPIGVVLIISPFNFPFTLLLGPLLGAIAAGCTVVLKPSELMPKTAAVTAKVITQALDPDCYSIVQGGVEETTLLLDLKWDKIFYTGNSHVARIVCEKAAKHLTPVILELGGMNPVFLTSHFRDPKLAAKRIAWPKILNAGQVCLSPNYLLLEPSVEAAFVEGYILALKEFFPNGAHEKGQMSCIVNDRHFNRIKSLMDKSNGQILYGGKVDAAKKWIEPTLVKVDSVEDSLFTEEIFGPILPYYVVNGGLEEMVRISKKIGDTPLAVYGFTEDKKEQDFILSSTRSGGLGFNDTIYHAAIPGIEFGGVGESGTGCYRGKHSFDAFIHRRPYIKQPNWTESKLSGRYPPYNDRKTKAFTKGTGLLSKPEFDRNGNLLYGSTMWKVLLLGAKRPGAGLLRYFLAIFVVVTSYLVKNKVVNV